MKVRTPRGLTLVEILVVVAVLGIIAAIAAPSFTEMLNRRRVQAVAANISTDIAYLRAEAALRPRQVIAFFNMNPATAGMSCYTVGVMSNRPCNCTDLVQACRGPANSASKEIKTERTQTSSGVTFAPGGTWDVAGSEGGFEFRPPKLTPYPSNFHVDVCGSTQAAIRPVLRIELSVMGRPKICSPNSSMSGYDICVTQDPISC